MRISARKPTPSSSPSTRLVQNTKRRKPSRRNSRRFLTVLPIEFLPIAAFRNRLPLLSPLLDIPYTYRTRTLRVTSPVHAPISLNLPAQVYEPDALKDAETCLASFNNSPAVGLLYFFKALPTGFNPRTLLHSIELLFSCFLKPTDIVHFFDVLPPICCRITTTTSKLDSHALPWLLAFSFLRLTYKTSPSV